MQRVSHWITPSLSSHASISTNSAPHSSWRAAIFAPCTSSSTSGSVVFAYTVIVQLPFSVWVYLQGCRIASLEPVLWGLSAGRSRGLSADAEKCA
nr:MAG TPA: hypothetical protein [Bacteriophage sp.]